MIRTECECCGFETYCQQFFEGTTEKDGGFFCDICASTFLMRATTYPQYFTQGEIYIAKSLGNIANMLFEKLA